MSERIRGSYNDALYKSTYTLLYAFDGSWRATAGDSLRNLAVDGVSEYVAEI